MGTVYRVEKGTGFYIPGITDKMGGKVEAATEYTIRMVLKLDKTTGWNRILNVNPGADAGFYVNGGANWYPSGRGTPASPTFPADEWHSLTISTGPDKHAAAYFDGGSKAEWLPHAGWDSSCRIVTSSLDVMMFFNDGASVNGCSSGGEHTELRVKTIQVFNERLTDAQVAQLEVDSPLFPAQPLAGPMWNAVGSTGWRLVRRVKAGIQWHPSTDTLAGTDVYGVMPSVDPQTADATFSISFSGESFTHFLFATGDEQVWLYCTKEAVLDGHYSNGPRPILKSSDSLTPYNARWYSRHGVYEDPWISVTDHHSAISGGKIVYGENKYGGHHAGAILPHHNGANVWIF